MKTDHETTKLKSKRALWFVLMYWPYYQGNCCTAYVTQILYKCKYFGNDFISKRMNPSGPNYLNHSWHQRMLTSMEINEMIFALAYSG